MPRLFKFRKLKEKQYKQKTSLKSCWKNWNPNVHCFFFIYCTLVSLHPKKSLKILSLRKDWFFLQTQCSFKSIVFSVTHGNQVHSNFFYNITRFHNKSSVNILRLYSVFSSVFGWCVNFEVILQPACRNLSLSRWSPLGVKFKISDEHPRLFHMRVPILPRVVPADFGVLWLVLPFREKKI